jgi:hypothetical protein
VREGHDVGVLVIYLAARGLEEADQEPTERGLPAAALPDKAEDLVCVYVEGDVVDSVDEQFFLGEERAEEACSYREQLPELSDSDYGLLAQPRSPLGWWHAT